MDLSKEAIETLARYSANLIHLGDYGAKVLRALWTQHSEAQATIARLTAERDEARARAKAAYERIADHINNTDYCMNYHAPLTAFIRALATEAEASALAEIVKKAVDEDRKQFDGYILHKRNCDMMSAFIQGKHCTCGLDAILARLDQRKEGA